MTRLPFGKAFFLDHEQRLAQRVDQRARHGVVILAPHPVVLEKLEIEIEASARDQPFARGARYSDRRHAGWSANAFLRA